MTQEYWFARRFPLGNPRKAFGPVHWKGWVATAMFILLLSVGAVLFAWFGAHDQLLEGAAYFIIISFIATAWFLLVVRANGDQTRTIDDYRKERRRA